MTKDQINQDLTNSLSSLLSSVTFADSIKSPTLEIKSLLHTPETVSILISMITQTTDAMLAKKIHLLFTRFDSSLLENLANDHESLHTLFQEIFCQSSASKSSTRFLLNIFSSAFSLFPSVLFDYLDNHKELLQMIGKSIEKFNVFDFVSDHFCKTNKGFQLMKIILENLMNEIKSSREFRKNSFKLLILFLQNYFDFPEFEEKLQDALPLLFNASHHQQEQNLILEIALLLPPSQFLIDVCHSIFANFTFSSLLIGSALKYLLYTQSFPSTDEIELFIFRFFGQCLNQNLVHSVYHFVVEALYEYDETTFKNHLKMILCFQFSSNSFLKNPSSRGFLPLFLSAIESDALEPVSSEYVEAFLNQDSEISFNADYLKSLSIE